MRACIEMDINILIYHFKLINQDNIFCRRK